MPGGTGWFVSSRWPVPCHWRWRSASWAHFRVPIRSHLVGPRSEASRGSGSSAIPCNLHSAKDMGTDDKLPDGKPAPAPAIYDIDGIINPASTVAALHALGKHVVCYVEVGAAGNYYSAAEEGIPATYYLQLRRRRARAGRCPAIPEYYLNIQSPSTVSIIVAR